MKFTIRDFCILLIATMKLQNNTHFNSNHISKNIGEFYDDFDTKILFAKSSCVRFLLKRLKY